MYCVCMHVINDIDLHQNKGSLLFYADDLLLYHPIQSPGPLLKVDHYTSTLACGSLMTSHGQNT